MTVMYHPIAISDSDCDCDCDCDSDSDSDSDKSVVTVPHLYTRLLLAIKARAYPSEAPL